MDVGQRPKQMRRRHRSRVLVKPAPARLRRVDNRIEQIASAAELQDQRHIRRLIEVLEQLNNVRVLHGKVCRDLAIVAQKIPHVPGLQPLLSHDLRGTLRLLDVVRAILRAATPHEAEGALAQGAMADQSVLFVELSRFLVLDLLVLQFVQEQVGATLLSNQPLAGQSMEAGATAAQAAQINSDIVRRLRHFSALHVRVCHLRRRCLRLVAA
mmetsp:Transcript_9596/g.27779  ORF Transcript_9596/g.27779 Transcript_9596/m.27779 type:complete len:212 (+) Transcript_9596:587-1222(+)